MKCLPSLLDIAVVRETLNQVSSFCAPFFFLPTSIPYFLEAARVLNLFLTRHCLPAWRYEMTCRHAIQVPMPYYVHSISSLLCTHPFTSSPDGSDMVKTSPWSPIGCLKTNGIFWEVYFRSLTNHLPSLQRNILVDFTATIRWSEHGLSRGHPRWPMSTEGRSMAQRLQGF